MLEELLKFDRLASKDELLFLLFRALPLSKSQKVSDLKKYCTSNHFSIGRSFDGTLKLLEFMAFINVSDGIVSINDELFDPAKIKCQEGYLEQGDFISVAVVQPHAISFSSNENWNSRSAVYRPATHCWPMGRARVDVTRLGSGPWCQECA